MKKYRYVYRLDIVDGPLKNHFYIGQHNTNKLKDNYHSSSKIINNYIKEFPDSYVINILKWCNSVEECCETEKKFIADNIHNPLNLNQIICASNYDRTEEQRKIYSELAKNYSGEKNPFYGHSHTDEAKRKQSETMKNKYENGELIPWNKGNGDYISGEKNPFYGHSHTDETRQLISDKRKEYYKINIPYQKDKIWINNGLNQTCVDKELVDDYINNGWTCGMIKRKK